MRSVCIDLWCFINILSIKIYIGISWQWDDTGCWKWSSWKTRIPSSSTGELPAQRSHGNSSHGIDPFLPAYPGFIKQKGWHSNVLSDFIGRFEWHHVTKNGDSSHDKKNFLKSCLQHWAYWLPNTAWCWDICRHSGDYAKVPYWYGTCIWRDHFHQLI